VLDPAEVAAIGMIVAASAGVSLASRRRPDMAEELAFGTGGE